jgi:hypothetical protein
VCNNTYALWQAGMQSLPSHLEFAPMTSYQVAAAKDWAAKEVVAREADMQPVEAPEEPVQPPAPPLVHVEAMPGHNAAVGTTVWSPERQRWWRSGSASRRRRLVRRQTM